MLLQLLGKTKNIPYGRDKPWVWERQHIVFQCSWCCDSVVSQSEFDYLLMWYPSTNCHELYIFCLLTRSIVGRNVDVLCLSHHFPVSSRHLLHSSNVSHWTSSECTRGRLRGGTLWGPVFSVSKHFEDFIFPSQLSEYSLDSWHSSYASHLPIFAKAWTFLLGGSRLLGWRSDAEIWASDQHIQVLLAFTKPSSGKLEI